MRDIKDLDKVEDIKSNWLVIETFHERYYITSQTCDTVIYIIRIVK